MVFTKFNSVPNTKMLTFYRKDTFTLTAAYDSSAKLPSASHPFRPRFYTFHACVYPKLQM